MRNVSQAYRNMMLRPVMESRMEISVTNGTDTITIENDDILKDSVSSNYRSTNNGTFSLGTCYSSMFSFSAFKGMDTETEGNYITIVPTVYYKVGPNAEQAIQLGVFRCDTPVNYTKTTYFECYDLMLAMDKKIESRFTGTPFNVLTFMCQKCGVTLGNTSQEIASMVNGSQTLVIDPNQVMTYRDGLAYISILLGGFAAFDGQGRLFIKQFHQTPDFTLQKKRRTSSSFAGYCTKFSGIKCRFMAEQNFYPYDYVDDTKSEGIILDVGDIPVVEGTPSQKQVILENIYNAIKDLQYYPCTIDMVGDPSFEAGDMIATPDREGYLKNILLTSVTWKWRQESTILSEGNNPKTDSVTTQSKKTDQRIENSSNNNTVVTGTYVNADAISIGSSESEEVTSLKFTTNKDLTAIFGAEIPVQSSGDGYLTITYENNGVAGDEVVARLHEGYNLVTLVNHLHYDTGSVVLLKLMAQTSAIGSGTAPTVTIAQDKIRSYIFAQGIEIEVPWDGIIIIAEHVPYVQMFMQLYGITESVSVDVKNPVESALSEVVNAVIANSQTIELSDTMTLTLEYGDWVLKMGMGHRAGMGRMLAPYQVT